jgi:hypothetical protein
VRRRALAGLVGIVLAASGCIFGDPGYSFLVRNDGADDVIVSFFSRESGYLVPAGVDGRAITALGLLDESPIYVLDTDCEVIAELVPSATVGRIIVDAAGARFEDVTDSDGTDLPSRELRPVDRCHGHVWLASPMPVEGSPRLAFIGGQDWSVHAIAADGTRYERLAANQAATALTAAAASPTIAYRRVAGDIPDVARLEVGEPAAITSIESALEAALSPDGSRMAYIEFDDWFDEGILHVSGTDGTELVLPERVARVAWSPDGDRLATVVLVDGDVDRAALWVMRDDGSERRCLVEGVAAGTVPSWAPTGDGVAVTLGFVERAPRSLVAVVDLDGAIREYEAAEGRGLAWPSWSPDGRSLAAVEDDVHPDGGEAWISVVDIESGSVTQLTDPPDFEADLAPVWSPDGGWIAFLRPSNDYGDLWVMRPDGSDARVLATGVHEAVWIAEPAR